MPSTAEEPVGVSVEDRIAVVTLNRPHKRNALDLGTFEALDAVGRRIAADRSLRACVLEGAGEDFCAGLDIGLFAAGASEALTAAMAPVEDSPANLFQRAAWAWREVPIPVIAAINGAAFGGGLQVALGADLRFASPDARLSIMEIEWGLVPDMALSRTLDRLLPTDLAKELAWTGRILDAAEARELGLVTRVVDDPAEAARALAREIAARSPDAIRAIKRLLDTAPGMPVADALALEARLQSALIGRPNQVEAAAAKLERREPAFADPEPGG